VPHGNVAAQLWIAPDRFGECSDPATRLREQYQVKPGPLRHEPREHGPDVTTDAADLPLEARGFDGNQHRRRRH
jgi:hypothetical protein